MVIRISWGKSKYAGKWNTRKLWCDDEIQLTLTAIKKSTYVADKTLIIT